MKRVFLVFCFLTAVFPVFAQRLPSVGIAPFEARGAGVSAADAEQATKLVIAELSAWRTMTVLSGTEAERGEYLVRGQISRERNNIVFSASTSDTRQGKVLNTAREEGAALNAVSIESLCAKITENVPYPNFLLGTWRSTIQMADGPLICVLEFRSNRTVRAARYDTWEHSGTDILKYQGVGSGTYTYAGYRRRTVVINRREIVTDATVGLSLALEDALPAYESVGAGGLRVLFNEERTGFELSYGGVPCGNNRSGPGVYPSERVYYTTFTKIE